MKLRLPVLLVLVFSFVAATRADSYSFKDPFIQTGPFNSTGKISLEMSTGHRRPHVGQKRDPHRGRKKRQNGGGAEGG